MKWARLITLFISAVSLAACSEQTRTASAQITSEEVINLYSEILESSSGADTDILAQLLEDPYSTIYHVGSDNKRPAVSVVSLNDFAFIDPVFQEERFTSFDVDMQYADVIFIDGQLENGERRFGLLMLLESYDGNVVPFVSVSEAGDYRFTDSTFRVAMAGANGERIILKSTDVSTKELKSSIKLDVWLDDGSQEYYMGQISTMSGFGGL